MVIIAAARVQADNKAGRADAVGQGIHIIGQISAAALLAGFNHDHTAGNRSALALERRNGGQGSEGRIAVVGTSPPVQLAVSQHRLPRAEPVMPAVHGRLLVQVAVEQHGFGRIARHLDKE